MIRTSLCHHDHWTTRHHVVQRTFTQYQNFQSFTCTPLIFQNGAKIKSLKLAAYYIPFTTFIALEHVFETIWDLNAAQCVLFSGGGSTEFSYVSKSTNIGATNVPKPKWKYQIKIVLK